MRSVVQSTFCILRGAFCGMHSSCLWDAFFVLHSTSRVLRPALLGVSCAKGAETAPYVLHVPSFVAERDYASGVNFYDTVVLFQLWVEHGEGRGVGTVANVWVRVFVLAHVNPRSVQVLQPRVPRMCNGNPRRPL